MSEFFLKIVNMSISASWLVLAVLLLRLILKKAPKWVNVLLWGIVAIRLVCPFSLESALSLIPSAETVSPEIMMDRTPEISTGIDSFDAVVNPIITESFAPQPMASANPLQIWIPVSANFWLLGIGIMLIYTAISYLLLRRKVATAIRLEGNIYQSENVASPFVLGIIKPKIYLPFRMDGGNLQHVIAHEQAHIRRKDHLWKPLGFLLLAIHWFNPMMWLGYIFLCKDIELACDEKVIQEMDSETKADYTQALVACSVNRRSIAACPLAFGEVDVKARVKSILHYKKPAFWIIVAAIVICAAVAVCFLTDPANSPKLSMTGNHVSDMDVDALLKRILKVEQLSDQNIYTNGDNFHLTVDGQFEWVDSQAMRYFFRDEDKTHSGQVQIFPKEQQYHIVKSAEWTEQEQVFLLRHYLNALKYLPTTAIRETVSADRYVIRHVEEGTPGDYPRVIMYSPEGVWDSENWLVHLQLDPLHKDGEGFSGSGGEAIHLFYWDAYRRPDSVETIVGNLKTYYKNADGTWACNGYAYKYRLEIDYPDTDTTFVYLSNLETISPERAMLAAGLSSSLRDYFTPEEAVLVEWLVTIVPAQITGVTKATLELPHRWDAPRTVTDPEILGKIERILQRSEVLESSAGCLFTGKLTLTLTNGVTLTLTMSQDNCATWLSHETYYHYGQETPDGITGNDELYDLFTVQ